MCRSRAVNENSNATLPYCFEALAERVSRGLELNWLDRLVNWVCSRIWSSYRSRTTDLTEERTRTVFHVELEESEPGKDTDSSHRSEAKSFKFLDQTSGKIAKIREGHLFLNDIHVLFEAKISPIPPFSEKTTQVTVQERNKLGGYKIIEERKGELSSEWYINTANHLNICTLNGSDYVPIEKVYLLSHLYQEVGANYCYNMEVEAHPYKFLIQP